MSIATACCVGKFKKTIIRSNMGKNTQTTLLLVIVNISWAVFVEFNG